MIDDLGHNAEEREATRCELCVAFATAADCTTQCIAIIAFCVYLVMSMFILYMLVICYIAAITHWDLQTCAQLLCKYRCLCLLFDGDLLNWDAGSMVAGSINTQGYPSGATLAGARPLWHTGSNR